MMVIEWLCIEVPVAEQAPYLAQDAAIWTAALARNTGYLGKEVWVRPDKPTTLNLIIRWASLTDWKAVPAALLAQSDAAFQAALGKVYPVQECITYEVR
jgi:uncharacterized protein (TIGR03792 family)